LPSLAVAGDGGSRDDGADDMRAVGAHEAARMRPATSLCCRQRSKESGHSASTALGFSEISVVEF